MPKNSHLQQTGSNKSKEQSLNGLDAAQRVVNALTFEIKTRFPSSKSHFSPPITRPRSMNPAQELLGHQERKENEEDAEKHHALRRP
jgi:hypothetical protein